MEMVVTLVAGRTFPVLIPGVGLVLTQETRVILTPVLPASENRLGAVFPVGGFE